MESVLKKGSVVRLKNMPGSFEVLGVHGRGGSCVAYRAMYTDGTGNRIEYLLKEFNPQSFAMSRDENGALVCPPRKREAFRIGLERFRSGYKTQEAIRSIAELHNATAPPQGIYAGNGTSYTITPLFEGRSYADIAEETLTDALTTAKTLVKVIGGYHRKGYLHLDIKPSNILVIPETRELLILFDFDSVIRKEQAQNAAFLSYTEDWAAPEQMVPSLHKNICEATDLFAAGEILFTKLMGRHSLDRERRPSCAHQELRESPFLAGADERVFRALADFFRFALCSSVKRRWQSAEDLLSALEEILRLAGQEHHICSSCPAPKSLFIGRDAELEQIHQALSGTDVLFLSGMGGVGKSELAKNYAARHAGDYDAVIFAFYSGSLAATLGDDRTVPISNFGQMEGEPSEEYFQRKLRKLKELCAKQRTLLILDNLNRGEFGGSETRHWQMLLDLPCKLLITSRVSDWELETMPVRNFPEETGMELFYAHYGDALGPAEDQAARELLEILGYHTMAVEMAAKQLRAGGEVPSELVERLKHSAMSRMGREKVRAEKDNKPVKAPAFVQIQSLFQVAELGAEEQKVLQNMALVHPAGITKRTLKEWCGLDDLNVAGDLCSQGWLSERGRSVSMHPLVSEVVLSSASEIPAACEQFLMKYKKYLVRGLSQMTFNDRQNRRTQGFWTASKLSRYDFSSEAVCEFWIGLGRLLRSLYDVSQSVSYSKRAMDLAERLYEPGSVKLAESCNNYGAALSHAGDRAGANEYYRKALEILALSGENSGVHPLQGAVLSNIANEYNRRGQFEEAEKYYKRALDMDSSQGKSEHIVVIHRNLGRFYMNIGKLSVAYEHLQTALQIQLDAGREHSTRTIDLYEALERYYLVNMQYEEAKKIILRAIDLGAELIGEQNNRMAVLYYDLSSAEIRLEDYDGALQHLQHAEEIFQRTFPEQDAQFMAIQHARGLIFLRQGNFAEAERLYQALYARQLKKHPDGNHRDIANTCVNLSSAYRGLGNLMEAVEYAQKGLAIFRAVYGEQHQTVATAYSSLGETQRMAGKLNEAVESLTKALTFRNSLFGENHASAALVHQRLGAAYRDLGDYDTAVREYAAALEIYRTDLPEALDAKRTLDELSSLLTFLGREEEAEQYRAYLAQS